MEREARARQSRFKAGNPLGHAEHLSTEKIMASKKHALEASFQETTLIKRDFFGRIIEARPLAETTKNTPEQQAKQDEKERKVWVTYHEGLNNAVRKPMSLQEFMRGL